MHTNTHEYGIEELVEKVIGAAYEVSNTLKGGLLEKVYERALVRELETRGLTAHTQVSYPLQYKGVSVGNYIADMVVEHQIVIELKCGDCFTNEHLAQALNYLRASKLNLALVINFQKPKVEWRRVIL